MDQPVIVEEVSTSLKTPIHNSIPVEIPEQKYSPVEIELRTDETQHDNSNENPRKRPLAEVNDISENASGYDGPNKKYWFINKAEAYLANDDYLNAKIHALKALARDGALFEGWFDSAQASAGLAKIADDETAALYHVDEALDELEQCKSLKPQDLQVFAMQGDLFKLQKEYEKAIQAFSDALNIDGQNADILLSRGSLYLELHEFKAASNDAEAVLKILTDNFDAQFLKGEALANLKKHEDSVLCFEACYALKPDDLSVQEKLVDQYTKIREFDKAIELCNKASDKYPSSNSFRAKKAIIFLEQQKFDLALPLVEDAIKIDKVKEEQCQISITGIMNQTTSAKIKSYRNAIVNEIEMPDDMKNVVIDVAVKAFKKHKISDVVEFKSAEKVAENIRNHFRKKYGGEWCCIVGQELAYYVAYEKYFISFNLGKVRTMLFKSP